MIVDKIEQDIEIIDLFNLNFDSNNKKLKYEVIRENITSKELPNEFVQKILVRDGSHPLHLQLIS